MLPDDDINRTIINTPDIQTRDTFQTPRQNSCARVPGAPKFLERFDDLHATAASGETGQRGAAAGAAAIRGE
jgi:hypothetical protein